LEKKHDLLSQEKNRYKENGKFSNIDMAEINKKYQVFVSSTYDDLQQERQEVIHALLELDCIPSGMELFPAADEDQWSLIKGVIDDCDYYIVIIGGRYGTIGPKGISYTEMEYRYALEKGKPIIAFLHKDPDKLPKIKTEKLPENQKKYDDFRNFAQKKMCKFWEDAKDLGSVVSRSLINLQKKHPGIGWVRGDLVSSKEAEIEILNLKQEIAKLRNAQKTTHVAPAGSSKYSQGEDLVSIEYDFISTDQEGKEHYWSHSTEVSWNELFYWILPQMLDPSKDSALKDVLSDFLYEERRDKYKKDKEIKKHKIHSFEINEKDYLTIIIQARALGLIERTSNFQDKSWKLTPYGDEMMMQLRAVKRKK